MSAQEAATPAAWARVPLGEVAHLVLGKMLDKAKRTAGAPMPYLRNSNVRWHGFDLDDIYEMPFEPSEIERYSAREGDVMICEGGEPGRAAVWRGPTIMFQKAIHRVRPRESAFDPRWLVWQLRHDAARGRLAESFTGTTIKHLTGSALARYEIVLPPITEQRRILTKLDELLARSRAARAALDTVPPLLDQYQRAFLAAAFRDFLAGTCTSYPLESLIPSGRTITYGIVQTGTPVINGVPTVRCGDIKRFRIAVDTLKRVAPDVEAQYPRTRLQGGEVLLAIRGSVGEVAIAPPALAGANVSREVAVIPPRADVDPEYLMYLLASPVVAAAISSKVKGVAQSGINIGDLRRIEIPLPSRERQAGIVQMIRGTLASCERLSSHMLSSCSEVDLLEHATLAKAFRGELVSQDPADEPAVAALARLGDGENAGSTSHRRARASRRR